MRRCILGTVYYKNEFLDSSQTITIIKNGRDLRSRLNELTHFFKDRFASHTDLYKF